MRLHLLSDLHLDTYPDLGHGFIDGLPRGEADVCVLAGDITTAKFKDGLEWVFAALLERYVHVVYVPGNHEYYGTDPATAHRSIELARGDSGRIHTFEDPHVEEIDGKKFFGGTMWFRDRYDNEGFEHHVNDFCYIKGFKPWVYEQCDLFEQRLLQQAMSRPMVPDVDVVVTHHMPHALCVHPRWAKADSNRFFVCDMEHAIGAVQPTLWLHGHTHYPVDKMLLGTSIRCNPRGYPRERSFGPDGYKPLLLEV